MKSGFAHIARFNRNDAIFLSLFLPPFPPADDGQETRFPGKGGHDEDIALYPQYSHARNKPEKERSIE
ncbi:MAG: hypothetical protein WC370_05545 [Dehalococcoidales bacterium]